MKVTIHRGTDQIGGCVTEYEENGWRLFVDYGEQLPGAPKSDSPLMIEGLNHGDLSKSALLITHYHGDHIGKLAEIAKDIPVYMGYTGCEIYRKLQRRLSFLKGDAGDNAKNSYDRAGSIHTFMDQEEFEFGPFSIRPIQMDHSAYDSYGFIISLTADEDNVVFHTGDFRAHGSYGQEFWDKMAVAVQQACVNAIVCEATNIESNLGNPKTEYDVQEKFTELFKQHKYNSVFVSSTNIDRLFDIYRAACAAGRVVLMDEYQYDILNSVIGKNDWRDNDAAELFNYIREDEVAKIVYSREEDRRVYDTIEPRYEFNKGLPYVLSLDRYSRKTPKFFIPDNLEHLIHWKGCVLIARSTPQFTKLIESFPKEKSKRYLSMWKGYLDSKLPAFNESLANAIGSEYEVIHTSGHADVHTLRTLFEQAESLGAIIPIHTSNPNKFMEIFGNKWPVKLLNDGEPYTIQNSNISWD